MNKEIRLKHIEELKPYTNTEVRWEDKLEEFPTYKIPLKYLVYNKYNGRILSRTKSLEKQGHIIDVESEEGRDIIAKLLWNSKIDRNKKTKESLKKYGQEKIGIVTKDGVIIDGNRRAMLLNELEEYDYFKAVVLPVESTENPLEIERLETSHQMGEDKKLDYNPIEKYIKVKELMSKLAPTHTEKESKKEIEKWMNEDHTEIQKYIDTMKIMDDYLDSLEYDGIYTQLDGREEQFIGLTKWLNSFYDKESGKGFDNYSDDDVDDLKNLAYDYIRIKLSNTEFRKLANGQKDGHLFGNEDIWIEFNKKHFDKLDSYEEEEIDYESTNIEAHLNDRDAKFEREEGDFLENNLKESYDRVRNNEFKNEPEKLVNKAKSSIQSIRRNNSNLANDLVQNDIKELSQEIDKLLLLSPLKTLEYINELLSSVNLSSVDSNEDKLRVEVSKINKTSFDLKKELGG